MSGAFYGTIQRVEDTAGRLVLRCVRDYFDRDRYQDRLMSDDVWIWEIDEPDEQAVASAKSMIGRSVCNFELSEIQDGQALRIFVDDWDTEVMISGKRVTSNEEPMGKGDLEHVVTQLSQELRREQSESGALYRKLAEVVTFVEQAIDRTARRAAFAHERNQLKSGEFTHEIDNLRALLRKLKAPAQTVDPAREEGSRDSSL